VLGQAEGGDVFRRRRFREKETPMNRIFMSSFFASVLAGALILATAAPSFGADEKEGKVARRQERQQKRIANGVANGSMTAHETAKVEGQESKLNKEVRADRKANGGNLTNNEKKQVNQQQNGLSKEIYTDKHNAAHQQP